MTTYLADNSENGLVDAWEAEPGWQAEQEMGESISHVDGVRVDGLTGHLQQTLTLTLESGDYTIGDEEDGFVRVSMAHFGAEVVPGKPQLPGKTFHVELPKGARVQDVEVLDSETVAADGSFQILPARAIIHDQPVPSQERIKLIEGAARIWETNYEDTCQSDEFYPHQVVSFQGLSERKEGSYAHIRFYPLQYRPRSGRLIHHKTAQVAIKYTLDPRRAGSRARTSKVASAPDRATLRRFSLSPDDSTNLPGTYNYVVIVPKATTAKALTAFKAWKELIGHRVAIVELPDIDRNYQGIDRAEKIRNFLVDKHGAWGTHYVLLVGDMDEIPTRILYAPDPKPEKPPLPYAADFYYADLTTSNWDRDDDQYWGEFYDDKEAGSKFFNYKHDVVVARLPLNDTGEVKNACQNIIAFEQDTRPWKRKELFAHGIFDLCPTDAAELSECIISNVLEPRGWTATKLYEMKGAKSRFTNPDDKDYDPNILELSQENYERECGPQRQAVVCLTVHGNPKYMGSHYCKDSKGKCGCNSPSDLMGSHTFGHHERITEDFLSAVVIMCGCSTAAPSVKPYYGEMPDLKGLGGRSLFQFSTVAEHNGQRYMRNGAVAVIGASAGSDYARLWKKPTDGGSQSLNYYFHKHLITGGKRVGDAFFDAMVEWVDEHNALERGIRDFYLMGDPSLIVSGIAYPPFVQRVAVVKAVPGLTPKEFSKFDDVFYEEECGYAQVIYDVGWEQTSWSQRERIVYGEDEDLSLSPDHEAYFFITFGPTLVHEDTLKLNLVGKSPDHYPINIPVDLKPGDDDQVGKYYWGSFRPQNRWQESYHLTLEIQARYGYAPSSDDSQPGHEIDSDPATVAIVNVDDPTLPPFIGYQPGVDRHHSVKIGLPILEDRYEPNNNFGEATELLNDRLLNMVSEETLTLHQEGDVDYFCFEYQSNEKDTDGTFWMQGIDGSGLYVEHRPARLDISVKEAFGGCIRFDIHHSDKRLYQQDIIAPISIEDPKSIFADDKVFLVVKNPDFAHQGSLRYKLSAEFVHAHFEIGGKLLYKFWELNQLGPWPPPPEMQSRFKVLGDPPDESLLCFDFRELVTCLERALPHLVEDFKIRSPRDRLIKEADMKYSLGRITHRLGFYSDAERLFQQSANLFREYAISVKEANVLRDLGDVYFVQRKQHEVERVNRRLAQID